MFKINMKDTRTTPLASFKVIIANFEHILHPVDFEEVNAEWEEKVDLAERKDVRCLLEF